MLYQEENEGRLRVISYASRTLSESERRYPANRLEFLALKWAVTEKFADYLRGAKFTVKTDSDPLTYVMTTAKLDACGQRWVLTLHIDQESVTQMQMLCLGSLQRIGS